ncbi:AMP-binding protein [Rariglobus hedericola]|uniref:AMP-binding protein n=2 Tax=Rariglobus hedericola TaxID=2597822 RepID=A0A556QSZ4_9BACT|nr:AMP-binding protein [Rariglobus hedericola]
MAASQPLTAALKVPRGRTRDGGIDYLTLSFAELAAEVGAWRTELTSRGVRPGDRVLVMVRPGLPLIAAAFALFAHGAVPVVIDPGMGLKSFLSCVERSGPRVLLGIPMARLVSRVYRRAFRTVELRIPASSSPTDRRASNSQPSTLNSQLAANSPDELAAILFTSGSTGAPKGVCYTHGMFDAQVELIRTTYDIRPGEIDLPLLPLFALFNPALGMTTIVPEIDPSRPATVDPEKIIRAILQENITSSFGSPTLWRKIAVHCHENHIALPTMRRVLCAGAPVPPDLWDLMTPVLPHGQLHSPYGATEALPVSTISAAEVMAHHGGTAVATQHGAGTCVGRPLPANDVRIIALTDAHLASLADTRELPRGQIGEIIVAGPTVTHTYDALSESTAAGKIHDPATGAIFHRMGDAGYLDADGRLWFCGRKAERVDNGDGPLFTEQVEPIFNTHADVRRSALVGLGKLGHQRLAVVIEPTSPQFATSSADCRRFARELREIAKRFPHTAGIKLFYFRDKFPVDVRHNAKIHRLTLARWAADGATGYESDPKR